MTYTAKVKTIKHVNNRIKNPLELCLVLHTSRGDYGPYRPNLLSLGQGWQPAVFTDGEQVFKYPKQAIGPSEQIRKIPGNMVPGTYQVNDTPKNETLL